MQNSILSSLLALALVLTGTVAIQAQQRFIAALNAVQVVPTSDSQGKGHCDITEEGLWGSLFVTCHYTDLSGGLASAHVHNESPGQVGKMYLDLNPPTGDNSGTFTATFDFTEEIGTLLLAKQLYVDLHSTDLAAGDIRGQIKLVAHDNDADGDGVTDPIIYRNNEGTIYTLRSSNKVPLTFQAWIPAETSPLAVTGWDFDGDGLTDLTLITCQPFTADLEHTYLRSSDNTVASVVWGWCGGGQVPADGDYDGDGKTDIGFFTPWDGGWYILQSSDNQERVEAWGKAGDMSLPGDYDGDGTADLCVVRNEEGQLVWYIKQSSDGQMAVRYWGLATDTIFGGYNPADVDGDGANDPTVARIEGGQRVFYALRSSDGGMFALPWGLESDQFRVNDFDGDGRSDFAALRNVDGQKLWYIWRSSDNQVDYTWWGLAGDE